MKRFIMKLDFNDDVFNRLSLSLDDVFPDIVNVFFIETESSINDLMSKVEEGKIKDASDIAHKIKSSSKTFGAIGLSDLLERIETQKYMQQTELFDVCNAVEVEFDLVKNHIKTLM